MMNIPDLARRPDEAESAWKTRLAADVWDEIPQLSTQKRVTAPLAPPARATPAPASSTTPAAKPENRPSKPPAGVFLTSAASIAPEHVKWIWGAFFAAGKLHIIAGPPGVAKTTLVLAIVAAFTTGGMLPDGTKAPLCSVAIWSGEDDPADTLIPRLIAAGADLTRVKFITATRDESGKLRPFDPAYDMEALGDALRGGDVRVLVLDPIVSAVTGDDHKNAATRRALQPVVDLAASVGCAVLGITHFSKGTQGKDPVERVTGSLAYGALARVIFACVKDKEAPGEHDRLFVRAKSNIGPDGGGWRFAVDQVAVPGYPGMTASAIKWGDAINGHARDLLAAAEINGDPEEHSATTEATEWLRALLEAGPLKASDVQKEARQAGITERPLRTARQRLGVKPEKRQFSGGWWWALPHAAELPKATQDAQP